MYLKRSSFPVVLLILLCGLFAKSHGGGDHMAGLCSVRHDHGSVWTVLKHVNPCVHLHAPDPSQPQRGEKRHGKSQLSQAIEACHAPEIEPAFTYCHRVYSLFLPGGCSRAPIGNFSLRGPPFVS